jgi:PAS domain S-box-containing protein
MAVPNEKLHGFEKRSSLKSKLLVPFIIILSIFAIAAMALSISLVSRHMLSQLLQVYDNHQQYLQDVLDKQPAVSDFYTRLILDLDRSGELKPGVFSLNSPPIPLAVAYRDNIIITWKANTLSKSKKELYASLFDEAKLGKVSRQAFIVESNARFSQLLIVSVIPTSIGPVITEMSIDDDLVRTIMADYQLDIAFFNFNDTKDGGQPSIIAASPLVADNPLIKSRLKQSLPQSMIENQNRFFGSISLAKTNYRIIFQKQSIHPDFYTALLIPLDDIRDAIVKIVLGIVSVLVLLGLVVFGVYSLIIKKLLSSIDILVSVAEKVSKGDLNQHVYVTTYDEIGELSNVINLMVSNLQESSKKLLQEKNQSETIINNVPEGIIVTDSENRLILANNQAEKMFDFRSDKVQGKFLIEYISNEDILTGLQEGMEKNRRDISREVFIPGKNGKDRVIHMISSLVNSKTQENLGMITVLRDITHEKELDQMRESFLRTVSHELRTPLTSIIGFIELTSGGELSDNHKRYLNIALDEAHSLQKLIDDLLDFSRMEAGQMKMAYSAINVHDFLNHVVKSLAPLAKGKELLFASEFQDMDLKIHADLSKLRRVLFNLVTNAIKFTDVGQVMVGCNVISKKEVEFYVDDTGIGLKEAEQEIIFERFRQVDDSSTRKYEGIGLGLSIVKQLVEMHGGTVGVTSTYGKGSRFFFRIPTEKPDSAPSP